MRAFDANLSLVLALAATPIFDSPLLRSAAHPEVDAAWRQAETAKIAVEQSESGRLPALDADEVERSSDTLG